MRHLRYLLVLAAVLFSLGACTQIKRTGTDLTPQVNFKSTRLTLLKGESVKIPVALAVAPTEELSMDYRIEGLEEGVSDLSITPSRLSFSPTKTTDTLILKNITERKEARNITLFLGDAPTGYRRGLISFVKINLLGGATYSVQFNWLEQTLNSEGSVQVDLLNEKGRPMRAPVDLTFSIDVDYQKSTAKEGVHFTFPKGREVFFKKGDRNATLAIKSLKYEEGADAITLNIVPANGFLTGQIHTIKIKMLGPVDLNGTWLFNAFDNKNNFLDWGLEDESLLITGNEGDRLVISGTPNKYRFTPTFKGTLRHYFTREAHGVFAREFVNDGHQYSVYTIDGINVNISASATKIRPAEVGFTLTKDEKSGSDILLMHIYDIEPTHFFLPTFEMMDSPKGEYQYPMLQWPIIYSFKRAE